MTDKILKIEYAEDVRYNNEKWLGYTITTEKQIVRVYIGNYTICCEEFDVVLLTPSNIDVSALDLEKETINLLSVGWAKDDKVAPQFQEQFTDIVTNGKVSYENMCACDLGHLVIDLQTSRGLWQLVAYNHHNGYYRHDAYVEWDDFYDTQRV